MGKVGMCVRLTTYHHPVLLSRNLGTLTSWNPLGLSRPVKGLLYLYFYLYPSILEAVPPDCREVDVPIELDSNEDIKTLGLLWHPLSYQFLINKGTCAESLREPNNSTVSKRIISSIVSTIFDPLGLISPFVVYKIFLQQLRLHKLNWDEQLPSELLNQWMDMYLGLSQVNEIAVDRLVLAKGQPTEIQLHGFCDSS